MAPIGTITYKGKSGTEYKFNVYKLPVTFVKSSGIYLYTKEDADKKHVHIYIGIADDLSTRFNNHHKAADIKKHGATHISILWEDDENKRIAIEKDILAAFNFPCNEVNN